MTDESPLKGTDFFGRTANPGVNAWARKKTKTRAGETETPGLEKR
jgi:hypothetical protein